VRLADTKQAREAEPYLAQFEDDWATGQILRQYINGKHKYENAKAGGKVKIGGKRKRATATYVSSEQPPVDDETGRGLDNIDNNGNSDIDNIGSDNYEEEDEWTGIRHDVDETSTFRGNDDDDNGDNI
jgi:hypothetical protein